MDPGYDVVHYGRGAYLLRPEGELGAEVLYRYHDGELTSIPLWPWPMEDRIARELGRSLTWEAAGGIWRALPPGSCSP